MPINQDRICFTLPDGTLCISQIARLVDRRLEFRELITPEDEADSFAYYAEKTLFELYRPWLTIKGIRIGMAQERFDVLQAEYVLDLQFVGTVRDYMATKVHFDQYGGEVLLTYREITTADLPANRENRKNWHDDGVSIIEI